MGQKADEYRQRAKEADEKAKVATDLEAKQAYRDIAQHWRTMAEQTERLGS